MRRDLATLQLLRKAGSGAPSWDSVTGKPLTFPPEAHTHGMADLTGFAISSPSIGQVLTYDGADWVNDDASAGGGGNPAIGWVI